MYVSHAQKSYQMDLEDLQFRAQIVKKTNVLLFLALDNHGHNDFPLNRKEQQDNSLENSPQKKKCTKNAKQ